MNNTKNTFAKEKVKPIAEASIAFSKLAFVAGFIVLDVYMIFNAVFHRLVLPEKERLYVPKVLAGFTKVLEGEWEQFAVLKQDQREE